MMGEAVPPRIIALDAGVFQILQSSTKRALQHYMFR